ncbi:heme ABC transporter ATP-binding protein [Paenibacillus radicis (ex Gao et al. 2016)]|uniref:ABC transporter ATP-binding protein n=1 Tax=Paenibacillus radicis (ex Gao et al. 2016) TaxID=1737354 RepID=A0A917M5W6_9BACL|nr:heme ABC transporter ATP-binding protein [Paenibacillus radicis (ex Gao et al. 2016)]GGG79977.1 ABC transporter ATP-binding protein [Paenibacillus radicis (ex Gao et al. 2016)]
MIEAKHLTKRIHNRLILSNVTHTFQTGRFYGIIGPNGVGKSTLLQLLSGAAKPTSGEVMLAGKPLDSYAAKQLARKLAVLQQGGLPPAAFTVREVVGMGRYPYQNWFGDEKNDPAVLVDRALEAMGLTALQNRPLERLSGGERQRAALAKVMVQEAELILLDEPTTYLDIGYQIHLLDTVQAWQRERELTVIAVLHDLNLAALYCDQLLVLHEGGLAASGPPKEVLNESLIRSVYGASATIVVHPATGVPQILLQPGGAAPLR